jgi:hypothetical protein
MFVACHERLYQLVFCRSLINGGKLDKGSPKLMVLGT